jgi:transcriptional regulator with XRE-family HTH domain
MEIYKIIKSRREQLGMTQEELARKLGYKSRSSINKIENGENDILQSKIALFAKALNTTTAYLMGWDDADTPRTRVIKRISMMSDSELEKLIKLLEIMDAR